MPAHKHYALIFALAAALPAAAQISEQKPLQAFGGPTPLRDASNEEMSTSRIQVNSEEPIAKGAVSVKELERPLSGKSKALIADAQHLLDKGDADKAIAALRKALHDEGAEPYAYSMLGAEHLRAGNLGEAVPELEVAAGLLPGVAQNHFNLALALARTHRELEALPEAQHALQLDPARADYRFIVGVVLLRLGKRQEAEYHLKKAAQEIPAAQKLLSETLHH